LHFAVQDFLTHSIDALKPGITGNNERAKLPWDYERKPAMRNQDWRGIFPLKFDVARRKKKQVASSNFLIKPGNIVQLIAQDLKEENRSFIALNTMLIKTAGEI